MFQRLGIPPDDIMNKPEGVRAFMFASMAVELEAEQEAREEAKNA